MNAAFFTAKTDVADLCLSDRLISRGFRLVETSLMFRRQARSDDLRTPGSELGGYVVEPVRPDDVEAVAVIAASTFRYSRFHVDPDIPDSVASRIKAQWARNLASGLRGSGCLVGRRSGNVVSFLGYTYTNGADPVAVIDLVGVDPALQCSGLGSSLVAAFLALATRQGLDIRVGTQAANRASIRLYESLGFRFDSAQHVLHGHTPGVDA